MFVVVVSATYPANKHKKCALCINCREKESAREKSDTIFSLMKYSIVRNETTNKQTKKLQQHLIKIEVNTAWHSEVCMKIEMFE